MVGGFCCRFKLECGLSDLAKGRVHAVAEVGDEGGEVGFGASLIVVVMADGEGGVIGPQVFGIVFVERIDAVQPIARPTQE